MGMPSPFGNQLPEKMCVVCGRLTSNDLVCDQCQSKRAPEPGVARGFAAPISADYEKREMSANLGWIVASVLCLMLAISFWYIFLQNKSTNDHREFASSQTSSATETQEFKAPEISGAPAGLPATINSGSPSNVTNQAPSNSSKSNTPNSQPANYNSPRTAVMPQTDNVSQYLDSSGVSGPEAFHDAFQQEYNKDIKNQKYETWDTYWDEIKKFYSTGSGHAGWQATGNGALSHLKGTQRQTIRTKWDNLGVAIASEVCKYEYGRKISTGDLASLYGDLDEAIAQDKGDGNTILAKLDAVTGKVSQLKS